MLLQVILIVSILIWVIWSIGHIRRQRKGCCEHCARSLIRCVKWNLKSILTSSYQTLASYVNAYDQKMFMKRENIADRGIWTAKKRYILNVWDSEGVRYEEPKLKMMGIEAVKSSTPAPCRKMIKDAIEDYDEWF